MFVNLGKISLLPKGAYVSLLLVYFSLAKPKILVLLAVTALSTAMVAGRGSVPLKTGILLLLAIEIASAGAAFLNNYFDRDIDAVMERTKNRPLPAGRVNPTKVFLAGLALVAVSLPIALKINYQVTLFIFAGATIYSLLYTLWLKRRTPFNILIGGLAGSCAVLAGWFAMNNTVTPVPILLALLVFLWTPAHFWSLALVYQKNYQQVNVPMLPALIAAKRSADYILLSTCLLLSVSLVIYFLGLFGKIYLIGSIISRSLFLASNVKFWHQPKLEWAWKNFKLSGLYLLVLFTTMVLDVIVNKNVR